MRKQRLCSNCGKRRPISKFRGVWRYRKDHNLCHECFCRTMDALRTVRA